MVVQKCYTCGRNLDPEQSRCPHCGTARSQFKRFSVFTLLALVNLVLIVVMAALVFLVPETYETPPAPSYTNLDKALPVSRSKVIPYDILREQVVGSVISVEILVDDSVTKDQVLALAQELGRSYLADESIRRAFVFIYDSREAQERRMDESYPRSDFRSHYLAAVSIDKDTGENTIRWTAEGRGH